MLGSNRYQHIITAGTLVLRTVVCYGDTPGQIVVLLYAECSPEQAPVLDRLLTPAEYATAALSFSASSNSKDISFAYSQTPISSFCNACW